MVRRASIPVLPVTQIDLRLRLALVQKVLLAGLSGGEVVLAHDVDGLAVELLGPGTVDVVRAQARLDVAHGDRSC